MIAPVLLAATSCLDSCAACTLVGKEAHLCEAHAAEERMVFARENRHLASKDALDRTSALDAVAALTQAHTNAPSEHVVDLIASALDDDSYAIRTHATELLGRPQNAESVLEALSNALSTAEKERKSLDKQEETIRKKGLDSRLAAKERAELDKRLSTCAEKKEALLGWRDTILNQLAAIPDDRAVEAIRGQTPRDLVSGGNEALVRLGSRAAMEAVLESIEAWDKELVEIKKSIADHEDEPEAEGNQMTTLGMTRLEIQYTTTLVGGEVVFFRLAQTFLQKKIEPPKPLEGYHEAWRTWVELHPELFPEHLPGVHSPAW